MQVIETDIQGPRILLPDKIGDQRGFFSEVYSRKMLVNAGINIDFIQDNHSLSVQKNVVRGMHYQIPPMAQDKLVRVVRGSILDIVVDVRKNSPTFGKHVAVVLSAENWKQIFVPVGFGHGFITLEPNTEVLYKVSREYSPVNERAFRWNDPALKIDWGVDESKVILSPRDRTHPMFGDLKDLF
jgi:dTDP-4-dehydrorhamnose 3,5-epimerase